MSIVGGIVIYFLVWWMVFMCALPFREHPQENQVPGTWKSAPEKPYIKEKFLISCLISALIWVVIWY
ncbi:MAG TPA: DUF1467 family protein, partial [Alphaproteobacteria bacterium]